MEENPSAIRDYLDGELREATIRLAFPGETVHVSPIGLIPKGGQPGLSSPHGASVNNGIDPDLCSLTYSSVNEAVREVRQCGPGALMAKLDKICALKGPGIPGQSAPTGDDLGGSHLL